jgi:hypothetical protein
MVNCIIKKKRIFLVSLRAVGLNFDKFRSEGPHEKHSEITWNLGTISAFA